MRLSSSILRVCTRESVIWVFGAYSCKSKSLYLLPWSFIAAIVLYVGYIAPAVWLGSAIISITIGICVVVFGTMSFLRQLDVHQGRYAVVVSIFGFVIFKTKEQSVDVSSIDLISKSRRRPGDQGIWLLLVTAGKRDRTLAAFFSPDYERALRIGACVSRDLRRSNVITARYKESGPAE